MDNDIKYDFDKFDIKKFDKCLISTNPNAIPILEKFPEMVSERCILKNSNAIDTIKKLLPKMSKTTLKRNFYIIALNTNPDIIPIIEEYLEKYPCIATKTFWTYLSSNPNAIPILEKNLKSVDWKNLSLNPNGLQILEKHPIKINWSNLSQNPNAVAYLENHLDKIDWEKLSRNGNAIHLLEQNPNYICSFNICLNPNATHILEGKIDELCLITNSIEYESELKIRLNRSILFNLNDNQNAIGVLETLMERKNYVITKRELYFLEALCKNPNAIHIVEKHIDLFNVDCWYYLSHNPNAIPILLRNIDKIDFYSFSDNENIMQLFLSDTRVVPETITRFKIPRKSERNK